jgi:hypothetical protein
MLSFDRIGPDVIVNIEHGIFYNGNHFVLKISSTHDYQAELLKRQFQKKLSDELEAIRREAYNQGWKDAKAKTKKQTWFTGWWK